MIHQAEQLPEALPTMELPRIDNNSLRAQGHYPDDEIGAVETRHGRLPIVVMPHLKMPVMLTKGFWRKRAVSIAVPDKKHRVQIMDGYAQTKGGR